MCRIHKILLVGLGAVGASIAKLIHENLPEAQFSALTACPDSYRAQPIIVNGEMLDIALCTPSEAAEVDLLIFAVKYYQLDQAIEHSRDYVGDNTTILSLLNGIDSEEIIRRKLGRGYVLPSTMVGIDVNRTGCEVQLNKMGAIYFADEDNSTESPRVRQIGDFFTRAGIPFQISDNITRCMWWKLMINVGVNQVSTVRQQTYGQFRCDPESIRLMEQAQREVIAIARKMGVALGEEGIEEWKSMLFTLHEEGRASMLQDFWTGRKMEIDALGGYVCLMGNSMGIPTPVNEFLINRLREMEKENKIGG